jgi:hypothetical protein
MGNNICRVILGRAAPSDAAERFAGLLRGEVRRPTVIYRRDLRCRRVRDPRLVAARNADLRLLDIDPVTPPELLARVAAPAIGEGNFAIRVADDEDMETTLPAADALARLYQGVDLEWVLEPEDRPIPWNNEPFFLFPGNPPHWGLKVPLMAALLQIACPGQKRPCPLCRTEYTSRGDHGQCPSCGFVVQPFRTATEAKNRVQVLLDAFAWGRCPRCRRAREFTYQVEQCLRCGQLLEGDPSGFQLTLVDNCSEVASLLASLDLK